MAPSTLRAPERRPLRRRVDQRSEGDERHPGDADVLAIASCSATLPGQLQGEARGRRRRAVDSRGPIMPMGVDAVFGVVGNSNFSMVG